MRWWLALMFGCWILAVPVHAGPDEPSHIVRSVATARGALPSSGRVVESGRVVYDVPGWAGRPDPGCYAFQPTRPVACLAEVDDGLTSEPVAILRSDYPPWTGVPAALGTFGPESWARSLGPRVVGAILPVVLVISALETSRRRDAGQAATVLVALTPMTVFSIAVVNPSGLTIAGAIALWTAIACWDRGDPAIRAAWLGVAGVAAVMLPRRDGLLWVSLILAVAIVADWDRIRTIARSLSRLQIGLLVLASLAALLATLDAGGSDRIMALTPLVLPAAWVTQRIWRRTGRWGRAGLAAGVVAAFVAALVAAFLVRPSGFHAPLLWRIVFATGANLTESIGLLGWLDAPMPALVVWGWCALLGMLFAAPTLRGATVVTALGILGLSIVVPWIVESSLEQYYGTYWQGRYTLPLLVGAAIWLGNGARSLPIARTVVVGSLVLLDAALLAAVRRWAVGIDGSYWPTDWATYDTHVDVRLVLVTHVAATVGLAIGLWRGGQVDEG